MTMKGEFKMIKINSLQQFEEIIISQKPIVIKFYANWCPDCKRMNLFMNDVLNQFEPFDFYEIDRDEYPELADQYDVMGIPSLLVFQNNKKIAHLHSASAKTPEQVTEFFSRIF
jgi:thioredoxin 1